MKQATHLIVHGSLVIWGLADRPCARLMAMVIKTREVINSGGIRQSITTLRYVGARPGRPTFNDEQETFTDYLEPIEHFGVIWNDSPQDATMITLAKTGRPPVARYKDGSPRGWQGELVVAVAPSMWELVDARMACGSPEAF
jgi:hypothetical protein